MKNKAIYIIMALTLCVGAFLFPTAAYAAMDTTPPTVRAWINGDLLHVEAFDDTGVEAAYINSARVNYRVDGSFDLLLRDYAGSDKTISVYAVDFSGNKSNVVELNNPFYTAPTTTPTPTPTTPTPKPAAPATPTPAPSATPEPTPEPSQSAVPAEQKPFTPAGTGTVVDNITEQNAGTSGAGKEFFTITTADDNVFYLIIDRQRDSENVYLLNAVTEDDLAALAEKSGSGGNSQSAIPTPEPEPKPTPEPTPTPEPEAPAKPSKLDPYKEQITIWLEEAPYSAMRILEKIKEQGFEGEYSIVKQYVRGKKEQLEEKATVRFETMPGLQGQMDWASTAYRIRKRTW